MKAIYHVGAFLLLTGSSVALGHEGHDAPGALPPPPNGGKIVEASHQGVHSGAKEELELFVEAKLQGTKIIVFAQGLSAQNSKVWQSLSPGPSLTVKEAKVEFPRSKKIQAVVLKPSGKNWEGEVGSLKEHRIILHVTMLDGAETKQAKVQLEK